MIEVRDSRVDRDSTVVEAKSNLSMSLDRLAFVFLGISAVTLLVALLPLIFGLWPIMVAAIVHLLIVGWCFRTAWRGNWARERIELGPDELIVEHFRLGRQERIEWPIAWVRVEIEPGRLGNTRVHVVCQGQRRQIGAFLPVNERLELARIMKDRLRPLTAWSDDKHLQVR